MSHFILQVPAVSAENYFTKEVIFFVLLWIGLAVSVLVCVWGYKYFQSLAVILLGVIGGYFGMELLGAVANPVVMMFLFVIFTMMAVCLIYGVTILLQKLLELLRLRKPLTRMAPVLTSLLGAAVAASLVYFKIFSFLPVCVVLFLVLAAGGSIYQIQSRKKTPEFHTYADLLKLKPQTEDAAEHD